MHQGASSPYHKMNQSLLEESAIAETAADLVQSNQLRIRRAPIRVRIILKGLQAGHSAAQVNATLLRHGLVQLYARSFPEAVLIYALDHQLSVAGFLALYRRCETLRVSALSKEWFPGGKVTIEYLQQYLQSGSASDKGAPMTQHMTRQVALSLQELPDEEALLSYLQNNLHLFSEVRERARYYFCKYLFYFLTSRVDEYISALDAGLGIAYVSKQIKALFRGWTYLDRHKTLPLPEVKKSLFSAPISLGGIFDEFSFFYYDYTTQAWTDLLLEAYDDNLDSIPVFLKQKYLRAVKRPPSSSIDRSFSDAVEARKLELDQAKGKDRCGETALRKYIRGQMDLDRTTLLCFLLFFSSTSQLPPAQFLDEVRLNAILTSCGFPALAQGDDFDGFVQEFLLCGSQSDAWALINSEIMRDVQAGENSFLYRSYRHSEHYYSQISSAIDALMK